MTSQTEKIQTATKAFNEAKILKGQTVSIATCDNEGTPNVAPVGSMRIVDEHTVHVLQGFLYKTCNNLKQNPKATFSVCLRPKLSDTVSMFKSAPKDVLGYQLYCEYVGGDETKEAVAKERGEILYRAPVLFRGLFRKFCEKNLSRLLKFRILDVREIGKPR
ncbi:MAG: pyridoxamine 5'-phosphate oxidase family protein [Myxococcota bacterium]|nr:pyridoxamine 5'-phosphate oxidase family protein [Myxococcota bacterium]